MKEKEVIISRDAFFCLNNSDKRISFDPKNPNIEFHFELEDGSILHIPSDKIYNMKFQYKDSIYHIVDKPTKFKLIKCGYIIKNNYDTIRQFDNMQGLQDRKELFERIQNVLENSTFCTSKFSIRGINITTEFEEVKNIYQINVDSINSIVNRNQENKIKKLPFYPFDKNMDKYNTAYLSIFADRFSDEYYIRRKVDEIVNYIISSLRNYGEYKFKEMVPKYYFYGV